jgi:integrase
LKNKKYNRWYYIIIILLNTGLRIGEFVGLTFNDLDFSNGVISINHQILTNYEVNYGHYKTNDKKRVSIGTTKTESGNRYIPMLPEVKQSLLWLIDNRPQVEEVVVDGVTGFLLISRKGKPYCSSDLGEEFRYLLKTYNQKNPNELLPKITFHCLRHTFCTNMIHKGMNIKNLQYLMGHADTQMTVDQYSHIDAESAQKQMLELCKSDDFE